MRRNTRSKLVLFAIGEEEVSKMIQVFIFFFVRHLVRKKPKQRRLILKEKERQANEQMLIKLY